MTKKKTTPSKGTIYSNYKPLMCLLMMWKILIAQIRKENYYSFECRGLFPEEQKGCHKGIKGKGDLLCNRVEWGIKDLQEKNLKMILVVKKRSSVDFGRKKISTLFCFFFFFFCLCFLKSDIVKMKWKREILFNFWLSRTIQKTYEVVF